MRVRSGRMRGSAGWFIRPAGLDQRIELSPHEVFVAAEQVDEGVLHPFCAQHPEHHLPEGKESSDLSGSYKYS